MLVAAQAMLRLIVTGMAELYPLVGALALGLTPNEIGEGLISLSITLFVTPLLYPHVQKRVGHTGCFLIGQTALIGANLAIPSLRALRDAEPALLWPGLAVVGVMRGVAGPFCFSSASVLFNNLLQGSFGAWNGIAQSCGSGARALAPTIFGSAFAAAYAPIAGAPALPRALRDVRDRLRVRHAERRRRRDVLRKAAARARRCGEKSQWIEIPNFR